MRKQRLKSIVYKHLSQKLSEEEERELADLIRLHPTLPSLIKYLKDENEVKKDLELWASIDVDANWEHMCTMIPQNEVILARKPGIIKWVGMAAAVIVIILIGIGILLQQGTDAGKYTTLVTPRTGMFKVTFPDGTRIWLNNASSLRYPIAFTGKNREVTLTGEAYFEVAKNSQHPLIALAVAGGIKQTIKVLGTNLNISAYSDEKEIRTTLLTGEVKVSDGSHTLLLSPNEQVISGEENHWQLRTNIDTNKITAWTKGYFHFTHESLPDILRQVARWYGKDVEISDNLVPHVYTATISRINTTLFSTLKILSGDNNKYFHFDIKENKILISR